jgi:hypothetical protein
MNIHASHVRISAGAYVQAKGGKIIKLNTISLT